MDNILFIERSNENRPQLTPDGLRVVMSAPQFPEVFRFSHDGRKVLTARAFTLFQQEYNRRVEELGHFKGA